MSADPGLLDSSTGRFIPFTDKSEVTIGRSLESTVNILSTYVSRNQCLIKKSENNEWILYDKSRFNSTLVNESSVPEGGHVLKDKDTISFVYYTDLVYHFYLEPPTDLNPAKKRKTRVDGESFNDIAPTQRLSSVPPNLVAELNSIKGKLAEKEYALSQLKQQNAILVEEKGRLSCQVQINVAQAYEQLKESEELKKKISSHTITEMKLEEQIKEMSEVVKEAELEIERLLLECECRFRKNQPQQAVYAPPNQQTNTNSEVGPPSPVPMGEDDFAIPLDDDFKSPHSTINGQVILDTEILDEKNPKKGFAGTLVGVELDFMRTQVKELKNNCYSSQYLAESLKVEKEKLKGLVADVIDAELVCSICSDILLEAVSLNCKHTFCKLCINEWKKKKKDCPVCRTKIRAEVSPLLIDSVIDKMVQLVGGEMEQKRIELKAERLKEEEERRQSSAKKRKAPTQREGADPTYELIGGVHVINVDTPPMGTRNQFRGRRRRSRR